MVSSLVIFDHFNGARRLLRGLRKSIVPADSCSSRGNSILKRPVIVDAKHTLTRDFPLLIIVDNGIDLSQNQGMLYGFVTCLGQAHLAHEQKRRPAT